MGSATLCGRVVGDGIFVVEECCDGGGTNDREPGDEPLRTGYTGYSAPSALEPISTEPETPYPCPPAPSFCFLRPSELNSPPVNALTLPLLVEAFIPAEGGASCRSTSCGYGRPSGARAIGWESTARSVISVAEVLSRRVGNCEAPETLREAGMVARDD